MWIGSLIGGEIVTRAGGRGDLKYEAYRGFMMAKSDMSRKRRVIDVTC
jgi:hypothetical protein